MLINIAYHSQAGVTGLIFINHKEPRVSFNYEYWQGGHLPS